jgi:hypothetical protein
MVKPGDTVTATMPIEVLEPISTEFFHSYGVAMAEWAGLERSLSRWFLAMTKMPEPLARSIFYSARSFNGRADMVQAAIGFCTQPQNASAVAVVKAGLKKAWAYSGFRNSMTHGEAILNVGPDGNYYSIVQGKEHLSDPATPILLNDLIVAAENFAALKTSLAGSVPDASRKPQKTLEQYLALIEALPKVPNSRSDRIDPEPEPQTEQEYLARRQKRAHDILNRGPRVRIHPSRASPKR